MDNVLQHSDSGVGYIMGVLHKTTNYIMFSLFDNGQGIFNSLRDSESPTIEMIINRSVSQRMSVLYPQNR